MKRQLQVEAIAHGTVIDHIPAGKGIEILKFFQLTNTKQRITIGLNLPTSDGKQKDLIKIEKTAFTESQANQLALFAPTASINVIENFEVVRKFKVSMPEQISGVFSCPNSNCVSHNEPVESRFYIRQNDNEIKLKCHYCEKAFNSSLFVELD